MAGKDNKKDKEQAPIPKEQKSIVETDNRGAKITSRVFIQKLKVEHKDDKILESVFAAFKNVAPGIDTEANYRKIWTENFKRK